MDLFGFMKRTTRWMRSYSISSVNRSYTTGYHDDGRLKWICLGL